MVVEIVQDTRMLKVTQPCDFVASVESGQSHRWEKDGDWHWCILAGRIIKARSLDQGPSSVAIEYQGQPPGKPGGAGRCAIQVPASRRRLGSYLRGYLQGPQGGIHGGALPRAASAAGRPVGVPDILHLLGQLQPCSHTRQCGGHGPISWHCRLPEWADAVRPSRARCVGSGR